MDSQDETEGSDELQEVLTRYVDSAAGYSHAAGVVGNESLAPLFLEIAESRAEFIPQVASMIAKTGASPSESGSTEGTAHRWWISLRATVTDGDLKAVLEECIRGEKVLAKALEEALEAKTTDGPEDRILKQAHEDVRKAISHFDAAIRDGEFH